MVVSYSKINTFNWVERWAAHFFMLFLISHFYPSSNKDLMLFLLFRFINARRRIVQPMIDQSNRAGKLYRNLTCSKYSMCLSIWSASVTPCSAPTVNTKRQNNSKRTQDSSQNKKKLHDQTKSPKTAVASQRIPVPFVTTNKRMKTLW